MDIIHDLCDELYEALMDDEDIDEITSIIQEILVDLKQTFKDEI